MPSVLLKLTIYSFFSIFFSNLSYASNEQAILKNYTDIAHAVFEDSLIAAKTLQLSIKRLTQSPNHNHQLAAQQAWIKARVPYLQSEVFRFGNPIVDAWEGQLNAWPLDEGLIDYVASDYEGEMGNVAATINLIASPIIKLGDTEIDARQITPALLISLNEFGGSEANVATGYHAIEFLLWGQDLNGTGAGAGQRPFTDYIQGPACTHGHCDRRAAYLNAAAQLLVDDLEYMVQQWQPGQKDNYSAQLLKQLNGQGLTKLLLGMGSLSLGELAGERLKVALEANSPEDEHDCFSDNTHHSHYYNAMGVQNIYLGQYRRIDSTVIKGPSLSNLVRSKNKKLDQQTRAALSLTKVRLQKLVTLAERPNMPIKFDQMIAEGNQQGNKMISDIILALIEQTNQLEKVAKLLGINNLNPDTAGHIF